MRILIQGINFTPELVGIGKYTGELASFLNMHGHEVRVVTTPPYYPQWSVAQDYSKWKFQKERLNGLEVFRCPIWVPNNPSGSQRLLHLLSYALSSFPVMVVQSFWKPDIIITIAPAIFSALTTILVARLVGSKTWLHIQDFELDAALALGLLPEKDTLQKFAQFFESKLMTGYDQVSTISELMIDRLYIKGVEADKAVLFPNWVDTNEIFPLSEPSPYRTELGYSDNKIIILYSGNMGQKQGLEILIDAARLCLGDDRIVFVLCGEGSVKSNLEHRASGLSNIRFLPLQPIHKLNDLLNLADIHVLPQRADASDLVMPSKLTGMLASGRPVVATAFPGTQIAKVVSTTGVVVPPGEPHQLARAIKSLVDDEQLRLNFGDRGHSYVKEHWGKESVLLDFLRQLEHVVSNDEGDYAYDTEIN
jgi:colanic acid biosynthesis glycosyl transferase WcaI